MPSLTAGMDPVGCLFALTSTAGIDPVGYTHTPIAQWMLHLTSSFPREAFLFFTFPFPPANELKPHWNDAITHRRKGSGRLHDTPRAQWMLHLTSPFPREAFLFFSSRSFPPFFLSLSSFFPREAFLIFSFPSRQWAEAALE